MKRGEEEARSFPISSSSRSRIAKAAKEFDPNQLSLTWCLRSGASEKRIDAIGKAAHAP